MNQRWSRRLGACVLMTLGVLLGLQGLFFHRLDVVPGPAGAQAPAFSTPQDLAAATVPLPERALVKDVTVAGIKRWPQGPLQLTYTLDANGVKVDASGKRADQACPT